MKPTNPVRLPNQPEYPDPVHGDLHGVDGTTGEGDAELMTDAAGSAQPDAVAGPAAPGASIAMSADQLGAWWGKIERSRARRKLVEDEWQHNIDSYNAKPLHDRPSKDWVNPNTDFADVEQKKSQLFFTTPEVHCLPRQPLAQGHEDVILIKQAVLNDKLGPNGVDAKRLMDKVIFDCLCPAGWGCSKLGYDATTAPIDHGGQAVDVPVFEEFFWDHFSPKKLLVPDDFYSNDFDKAPWIGMEFTMPLILARRKFKLPADFQATATTDDAVFTQETGSSTGHASAADVVTVIEIWYLAALEDETVFHPEFQRKLVLVDGMKDQPASHVDSPYQHLDDRGRLTAPSMIGYPIHVLTIRDCTDSAYIRSDCSMTRDLVDQLSKFLTTQVQQRDTSIPLRMVDEGIITPPIMAKITSGEYGSFIPLPAGSLVPPPIVEIARAQYPRENFSAQDRIERQLAKTLALDSNQQGVASDTERTATELTLVQNNATVRLKAERNRCVAYFIAGVRKFDSLIQQFATDADVIQVTGPAGDQVWKTWDNTTISGRFAYAIKPDSGLDVDEATERKHALDTYNMLGKDPLVNRAYLINELAPALHLDPIRLKAPPPPPPPPPKPSISFAFKGEDLLNPLALAVMIEGGVLITADMIQQAHTLIQTGAGVPPPPIQPAPGLPGMPPPTAPTGPPKPQGAGQPPAHPGTMPKMENIDDHKAQLTGAIAGAPNLPQRPGGAPS